MYTPKNRINSGSADQLSESKGKGHRQRKLSSETTRTKINKGTPGKIGTRNVLRELEKKFTLESNVPTRQPSLLNIAPIISTRQRKLADFAVVKEHVEKSQKSSGEKAHSNENDNVFEEKGKKAASPREEKLSLSEHLLLPGESKPFSHIGRKSSINSLFAYSQPAKESGSQEKNHSIKSTKTYSRRGRKSISKQPVNVNASRVLTLEHISGVSTTGEMPSKIDGHLGSADKPSGSTEMTEAGKLSKDPLQTASAPTQPIQSLEDDEAPKLGLQDIPEGEEFQSKWEYLYILVSLFIGVSNFYRFPDRAIRYGGYAYFVPYLVCTLVFALPLAYIEAYLGRFLQESPILGYEKIAPILTLACWTDLAFMIYNYLHKLVHFMLVIPGVWKANVLYTRGVVCTEDAGIECFSHHNNTFCSQADRHNGHVYHMIKKNCLQGMSMEHIFYDPFKSQLPTKNFYQFERAEFTEFGEMNIETAASVAIVTSLLALLLLLPIKHFARFIGALLALGAVLLILLVMHTDLDWPGRIRKRVKLSAVLYPKWQKIAEVDVWTAALAHSVKTYTIGVSAVSSVSSFTRRDTNGIRYITAAVLVDFFFGFLCLMIGARVSALLQYTTRDAITTMDVAGSNAKASIRYILELVPQTMSYYKETWWLQLYLITFGVLMWTNLMVTMLYVKEFSTGLSGIRSKRVNVLLTCIFLILFCWIFCFENGVLIYAWFRKYQEQMLAFSLAFKQLIIIGCYGAAQVNFDIECMQEDAETRCAKLWEKFEYFLRKCYFYLALPIIMVFISNLGLKFGFEVQDALPSPFFQAHPLIGAVGNPAGIPIILAILLFCVTMSKYNSILEVFKVQPGLPSYQRIRVEIHEFAITNKTFLKAGGTIYFNDFRNEDIGGKDLDDLRLQKENANVVSKDVTTKEPKFKLNDNELNFFLTKNPMERPSTITKSSSD